MTLLPILHLPLLAGRPGISASSPIGDLVKYRIDLIEADADAMRSYIHKPSVENLKVALFPPLLRLELFRIQRAPNARRDLCTLYPETSSG